MFNTIGKLQGSLSDYERLEIEGDDVHKMVDCYPDMKTFELHQTLITNMESGAVTKKSKWVVDYRGALTEQDVQTLAEKHNVKIVWRRQTFQG